MMQDLKSSCQVGNSVASVLKDRNGLIIASSDMTHYEPQEKATKKDKIAINAVLDLSEEKYYQIVKSYGISTCGYGPTIAAITGAKRLGAKKANLLHYGTSGDVLGDHSSVVGYAAISFLKF
jgi:AmmeMemoRadiSam system protein B